MDFGKRNCARPCLINKEFETMDKYICGVCGFEYDPAEGDPEHGIPAGTPFDDLPDDWWEEFDETDILLDI